jgi:AraC-like DNA-binding protein
MMDNRNLIEALASSKVFQDYERAFTEATGLPVALRPLDSWQLPYRGKRTENGFCALMAEKSRACANCLQVQQRLSRLAAHESQTITCTHGLTESAVPVRLGDRLIGFLQTGQLFRRKPTQAQFERTAKIARGWGVETAREALKEAYFHTRVLAPKQYEATVKLLAIFAQHLSMITNQVVVRQERAEPPIITHAKDYILEHQTDDLSLGQVAKAVNTSTFYFCKLFRKCAGINYTDYVARVRIEKAKNLLLNPNLRISEIAFEVGFQSLTHFNRVFKRIVGLAPTAYRNQLRAA